MAISQPTVAPSRSLVWVRRICIAALLLALVLTALAYLGFRLEDNSPLALVLFPLWLGMILGWGAVIFGLGRWIKLQRPVLAWWQTAILLALLCLGVFSACGAMTNLPSDGQAAIVNGTYVIQAHGSVVREISRAEYERQTNLLAYLFFGGALAVWSALTVVAFMASPKQRGTSRVQLAGGVAGGTPRRMSFIFRRHPFESQMTRTEFVRELGTRLVSGWHYHLDADKGDLSGRVTADGFELRARASRRGNAVWVVGRFEGGMEGTAGALRVYPEPFGVLALLMILAMSIAVQFLAAGVLFLRIALPAFGALAFVYSWHLAFSEWQMIKGRLKIELATDVDD